MATTTARKTARKPLTAAQIEKKQAERKATTEALQASLVEQVNLMATSEGWKAYLDSVGSFHSYSFNNAMLILIQHPTATQVAGYKQWQEKGRQVRKGEKGIKIYGFSSRSITEKDDSTGEDKVRKIATYPILSVFAEDQTDPITDETIVDIKKGNPKARVFSTVPAPTRLLDGEDVSQIAQRGINVIAGRGWDFAFEDITDGSNGYCTIDGSNKIRVRISMSPAQTAKTVLHELAHSLLHAPAAGEERPKLDRATGELEAESVAYVVAGALGLDTSDYSVGYLAQWSGGNGEAVKATAERVLKGAHQILDLLDPKDNDNNEEEI